MRFPAHSSVTAPVVTVTTSTSTSTDEKGQSHANSLSDSGNDGSRVNHTKNHTSSNDNSDGHVSRDNNRDTLDLTSFSGNFSNSNINLSPVQVINYDTLNDSVLLDAAAATVDRRVGSHFQNQRLNQITHQYHLQRTPVAAVQSPTYSHYDIVDSNNHSHHFKKAQSTDFVYFDEDRDSEASLTRKNNQFNEEKEKHHYNHFSRNNDHSGMFTQHLYPDRPFNLFPPPPLQMNTRLIAALF